MHGQVRETGRNPSGFRTRTHWYWDFQEITAATPSLEEAQITMQWLCWFVSLEVGVPNLMPHYCPDSTSSWFYILFFSTSFLWFLDFLTPYFCYLSLYLLLVSLFYILTLSLYYNITPWERRLDSIHKLTIKTIVIWGTLLGPVRLWIKYLVFKISMVKVMRLW